MTAIDQRRARKILRQRLAADVVGLPVVWALFVAFLALVVAGVALLRPGGIEVSGWEQAAQLARWYAGGVGVYLTAVYLPLYITHGYTRREFATQLPAFVVIFAAAFAALMTLGYGIEAVVYRLFGWPQVLTGTHLFDATTQFPLVFTEFLVIGCAWTVGGALLGGAFYRNPLLGFGLLPVVLSLVGLVEYAAGPRYFGPIPVGDLSWLPGIGPVLQGGSAGAAVLASLGVLLVGLALVWAVVRDLPVRTKHT